VAGKITGPGSGAPGNVPVGGNDESRPVAGSGAPFADKLRPAEGAAPAGSPAAAGAARAAAAPSATADLAADLKAGKISPQAAVEKVIDRVVDRQLGAHAPVAAREKLRAALENAVADDPLLADKIRALS
jgi:hypothetical protein